MGYFLISRSNEGLGKSVHGLLELAKFRSGNGSLPHFQIFYCFADEKNMDVKKAVSSLLLPSLRSKDPVDRAIKSGNTTDRDGNGQMSYGENKEKKKPLTEEEFQAALKHLMELEVVKAQGLVLEVDFKEGRKFVLLKDRDGKVLRRINEAELATLNVATDKDTGQLLRKTA